jgi:hypothetical protein
MYLSMSTKTYVMVNTASFVEFYFVFVAIG